VVDREGRRHASRSRSVKAIVCHEYGSPDVLRYEDVEKPIAGDDEVLIKVCAASVNPLDWHFLRGTPLLGRIAFGLRKPKITRPGRDVAGRVQSIGRHVTALKPGDEVFGSCRGAFAEYACTSESAVARKPSGVPCEQAACVAVAGLTALQGLRDKGQIQPGHTVLINGAAGGVGTFAVQIAKVLGATVTGVCSTKNVELVRSIGADRVIDYTQEDFTRNGQRYDVIFDLVGNHSFLACRRVLNPTGLFIAVGGGGSDGRRLGRWLAGVLGAVLWSRFLSQKAVLFGAKLNKEDLAVMGELMETGKVTPVIDRRYELSQVPAAIRYLTEGHARGKIVITC
jgi:NADPH:quinone reductase-like Zn-dependent oxidoreductase